MSTQKLPGRNWWKLAFFIALFAFEGARELWVLAVNEPNRLITGGFIVYGGDGRVHAEGRWKRSDGGGDMMPGNTVIDCVQAWNTCVEVINTYMPDLNALNTSVDMQPIQSFTDTAVVYGPDGGDCFTYQIRIDLVQNRVIGTRDRRPDATGECANLEKRVAMELGGYEIDVDHSWTKEHFLPLYRVLVMFLD